MGEEKAAARTDPLLGTLLGRYELTALLGEGGMGTVYEAVHRDLGKRAALKTLRSQQPLAGETRQRFLREGQAAARIRHPNVADVYDVCLEGEHPYLVMELLEGEDLSRLLAREGPLSVEATADLLVPVVAAVCAAHALRVVHRDLKPGNIFLATVGNSRVPKVLDFGISKLTDSPPGSTVTRTGAFLGTPHYMSPEQALGARQSDARSDQYSLGVILYECVTGRRPLEGSPLYALMHRTIHGDFPPPREHSPGLSSEFEAVILRAMARRAERRFPTTQALGKALIGFASPRVRADYEAQFSSAPTAPASSERPAGTAPVGASPEPNSEPHNEPHSEPNSTLGESVQVRPLRARAWQTARSPVGRVAGFAALGVALMLLGAAWWLRPPARGSLPAQAALESVAIRANRTETQPAAPKVEVQPPPAPMLPALRQRAEQQMKRWQETPQPEECARAQELWRLYAALATDGPARQGAQSALSRLGSCAAPPPVETPPAAPDPPRVRPKPAAVRPRRARASAPIKKPASAAPAPLAEPPPRRPSGFIGLEE